MKKTTSEFFRIRLNGKEQTIMIIREHCCIDDSDAGKAAKLWMQFIDSMINDMFNTEDWEYLGDAESFTPEPNTTILMIKKEIMNQK